MIDHTSKHTTCQKLRHLVYCENGRESAEAKARLVETALKLDESESYCRDLEARLSSLQKKSENALGEERLKVSWLMCTTLFRT